MQALTINTLRQAYHRGDLTPAQVLARIRDASAQQAHRNIWIYLLSESELQPYLDALQHKSLTDSPLWGIPFAIKDNIDLAGIPTSAGCEAFTYVPEHSAHVVQRLIDAGAIPVGKTNLDQFATGLNGTRSPWGACRNAYDDAYISGGSSSGSAVAVALGLASFSLGTDTAGSGRVPACFNNLVGLKPTRGLLSASGMVPACRSLDCMTVFAHNSDDAHQVLSCAEGFDPADGYSRANPYPNHPRHYGRREGAITLGIIPPSQLRFFGDEGYAAAYQQTLEALSAAGVELVEIDYQPFDEAARLLYEGPWVAERYLAIEDIIKHQPDALLPVIREIIGPGGEPRATDLFRAQYRLEALRQQCLPQLDKVDALLTPTAGRLFTIEEMLAEPIARNSELGYYTNYMNLLDMTSIAIPTTFTSGGLPFGVTLVSKAFTDRALLSLATRLQPLLPLSALDYPASAATIDTSVDDQRTIEITVCGAHLEGLPLNWQLTERGATLIQRTQTASRYRMYALAGGPPFRPGLIRDSSTGAAIEVEVWRIPAEFFGSFVAGIPAPLGIGKVELADGSWTNSFICESYGIEDAEEITHLGGWRAYLEQRQHSA